MAALPKLRWRRWVLGQPPNFGAVLFGAGRLTRAEEGALDPIVVGGVSHIKVEMKSLLRSAPVG